MITQTMPKFTPYTVSAQNYVTGRRERITISVPTQEKFHQVGRRRPVIKPKNVPLIKRFDPEFTAAIMAEHEQELADKRLCANLLQKRRLLDRVEGAVKLPLADRIAPPSAPYKPPQPIPSDLHFRKTKLMSRQREYLEMLDAVFKRVTPVYKKVKDTGTGEKIVELFDVLDQISGMFERNETDGFTHKQWRQLKRDFKAIGRIDMNRNLDYVVNSLTDFYEGGAFSYLSDD